MEKHIVKIKSIGFINHNVLGIVTEKPDGYNFEPGQATEVSINQEKWRNEKRPFTFTNLPMEDHLEFTIKTYPAHNGVTEKLSTLSKGDELILRDVFGAITYKGKGTFLAGGAGVTPFIAILKSLEYHDEMKDNALIFANKEEKDIFLRDKFETMLGRRFLNILSEEETEDFPQGHMDKAFLKSTLSDFSQYFYVCGPPEMVDDVVKSLMELGAEEAKIVTETS